MKLLKPLSASDKKNRKGAFLLLLLILLIQLLYWKYDDLKIDQSEFQVDYELDSLMQLKANQQNSEFQLKPFNANYINDYSAYVLGMSSDELHQIEHYRSQNKFIYSLDEFQKISGISDSLKIRMKPYLKFPKRKQVKRIQQLPLKDINQVSAEELKRTYGIGEVLSKRIVAYRISLGGFSEMKELYNVYGLDSIVVQRLIKVYTIQ